MITIEPIAGGKTAAASSTSSNSANPTSISDLGPNAFITLLTAQLQAQDPLNPIDPNQMVTELTSMNTLQEIIQIRQDMDTLANPPGTTPPTAPAPGVASASASSNSSATAAASTALSAGLAALTKSLVPSKAANVSSASPLSLSKSQLF